MTFMQLVGVVTVVLGCVGYVLDTIDNRTSMMGKDKGVNNNG